MKMAFFMCLGSLFNCWRWLWKAGTYLWGMNILVLNNRVPWPLNDGGNLVTYSVAKQLAARGHQITLACLNTRKHHVAKEDLPPIGEWVTVDIDTGLTPWGLLAGFFSSFPYNIKRFRSGEMEAALVRLLQRKQFDLIQVEGSYMALYVPLLRKLTQAPIILRSHNVEHEIWDRTALATSGLRGMYLKNLTPKIARFEKETLHSFDAIVPITDKDRDWYRSQGYTKPMAVVTAGVDAESLPFKGDLGNPRSMCFIGSLEWMPNVQGLRWFVENVWVAWVKRHPEAQLHIAGKNPPADLQFDGVPGIVFHGMVPDAYAFMAQHGILVTPLLSGSGMRVKVVEGMAMGKCIVSTTIGAEGVEYEAGKHLLVADSPSAFEQVLDDLMLHPEKVEAIGLAARQQALEKYDWARLLDRLEGLYAEVLGSGENA